MADKKGRPVSAGMRVRVVEFQFGFAGTLSEPAPLCDQEALRRACMESQAQSSPRLLSVSRAENAEDGSVELAFWDASGQCRWISVPAAWVEVV